MIKLQIIGVEVPLKPSSMIKDQTWLTAAFAPRLHSDKTDATTSLDEELKITEYGAILPTYIEYENELIHLDISYASWSEQRAFSRF